MMKMCCVYIMEYYSAIKKNEIRKLTGKWMELDKTDPKRQAWYIFSFVWMLALKPSVGMLQRICIA